MTPPRQLSSHQFHSVHSPRSCSPPPGPRACPIRPRSDRTANPAPAPRRRMRCAYPAYALRTERDAAEAAVKPPIPLSPQSSVLFTPSWSQSLPDSPQIRSHRKPRSGPETPDALRLSGLRASPTPPRRGLGPRRPEKARSAASGAPALRPSDCGSVSPLFHSVLRAMASVPRIGSGTRARRLAPWRFATLAPTFLRNVGLRRRCPRPCRGPEHGWRRTP